MGERRLPGSFLPVWKPEKEMKAMRWKASKKESLLRRSGDDGTAFALHVGRDGAVDIFHVGGGVSLAAAFDEDVAL